MVLINVSNQCFYFMRKSLILVLITLSIHESEKTSGAKDKRYSR